MSSECGVWQCHSCNLLNFDIVSKCQACFTPKFHSTFNLRKGYHHLSDKDLSEIILKCDKPILKDIFDSLEYHNAIYRNHSFLSLLIDIGKINLIFLLFENEFKFALNYALHNNNDFDDDAKESSFNESSEIYVEGGKILPLSMAFERDEIYLIKLLLKKGADPNQCTKPENLSLHYEWFDLSRYEVYLHYLPLSIPLRKTRECADDVQLAEYEEIFDMLIHYGGLWFEDEFMFLFCNKDASFWIDFLSSYKYRKERYFVHNAMKKYYKNTIKPLIERTCLHEVESVIEEYFVTFPMIDIPNQQNQKDLSLSEIQNVEYEHDTECVDLKDVYAKVLAIKQIEEKNKDGVALCQQYEYTVIDDNDVKINMLIHDARIWKELSINDIIYIQNATLLYPEQSNTKIARLKVNDGIKNVKIVHSMTLTPSITVISDEKIKKRFQNTR